MGQQDSKAAEYVEAIPGSEPPHDFYNKVQEFSKNDNLPEFKALWARFVTNKDFREKPESNAEVLTYYKGLLADGVMDHIKNAFRHEKLTWRTEGILVARTFFHIEEARRKLIRADFIGSVLLITLPEASSTQEEAQEQTPADLANLEEQQEQLQLLAAETFREMAKYQDFLPSLCATSVLNFLCIVLNQVPKAQEIVTETFVKLSDDKRNLIVLMEGAMGDILETFFKTVAFQKPDDTADKPALQQWRTGTIALSNTAQALAMLIKYNHPCQVDMPTIIKVFSYSLAMVDKTDEPKIDITGFTAKPDNVQLLAEMSQLLYWKCRTTHNTTELIKSSAPRELGLDDDKGLNFVLQVLVAMWKRCIATQTLLESVAAGNDTTDADIASDFVKFRVDDLDRNIFLSPDSEVDKKAFDEKKRYAEMRLCYLNCTLWVLLPMSNLRWKLKDFGLQQMHLAFKLTDEAYLLVILGTVRYLVDLPAAQQSTEFVMFFGEQLLILLDLVLKGQIKSEKCIFVLLDAISILAMARDMQEMLAKFNIHTKLLKLDGVGDDESAAKIELAVLRSLAEVAIHPSHRLKWVDKKEQADEAFKTFVKDDFQGLLQTKLQRSDNAVNDNFKTIASLLLTILREEKFRRPAADIEAMFRSVSDWWLGNSTACFDDGHAAVGVEGNQNVVKRPTINLPKLLQDAIWREQQNQALTVRDSEKVKCPHECVIVLSLFSRLALEPKFKLLFVKHEVLDPLLGCICVGIWAEAREAAATLANLMWLPDLKEEGIVCWLKLDGPRCVTVDASNVLMPVKTGNPKPVDIGKGMYKSSWGIEFKEGAVVMLHPKGLQTHRVPGMLTSASPMDTFKSLTQPYEWFAEQPADAEKWFTLTCWFYWPLHKSEAKQRVLVHSAPSDDGQDSGNPTIFVETDGQRSVWCLHPKEVGQDGVIGWKKEHLKLTTPEINPGWHMVSVVSSTVNNPDHPFNGTKFYLDDWSCSLEGTWIPNDFKFVGNSSCHRKPFGLITDFRIYSRVLKENDLKSMVREPANQEFHPDQLTRKLAERDAASILALRLDVPDTAAECLRALGSLASLASERAKIFSVCGRRVLQLIDSPLPMIQRQAARLINNIT